MKVDKNIDIQTDLANLRWMQTIWATPWENVSSGVSDQLRLKPACAATEAS